MFPPQVSRDEGIVCPLEKGSLTDVQLRVKRRRFRRLQHPWVTMRGPTPCWALRSLGPEASPMAWCAHGDEAPAQAASLTPLRCFGRPPVCAGLTALPSRLLKLLRSRVQSVLSPGACHFCSDDGYGKT